MMDRAKRRRKMRLQAASRRRHSEVINKTWSVRGEEAIDLGEVSHKSYVVQERMQAVRDPRDEVKCDGRTTH